MPRIADPIVRLARTARRAAPAVTLAAALLGLLAPAGTRAQGVSPIPLEAFAENAPVPPARSGAPRLVVALLYDQLRGDLLDRFAPAFGRDGFRRLERGGTRFLDCTIPYAITVTGPGHATWLSGTVPAVHGIVGNEWHEEGPSRTVACAADTTYASVGVPGRGDPGSPRLMRAQTVADVLREVTRGAGKVVAIADKARSAILPAGRKPTGVYWLDGASGLMQSSTYYASAFPAWAEAANAVRAAESQAARLTPWTPLLAAEAYRGTVVEDPRNTFPHVIRTGGGPAPANSVPQEEHPFALGALFDFAEAAVRGEDLGADRIPDLLIVSVALPDEVGHRFGPDSPEALDVAARADRRLATFLRFLDRQVGAGRYVVTVTSDHGVSATERVVRAFEAAPFDSVGGVRNTALLAWAGGVLVRAAGARGRAARPSDVTGGFAHAFFNRGIVFEDSLLARIGFDRPQAARIVARAAHESPWLATGFTAEELAAGGGPTLLSRLYAASWFPDRSPDVFLVPRPFVLVGRTEGSGTTHGSPYYFDRHVPLLFWGQGIRRGTVGGSVSTLDIAPTVATILGVPFPAQNEGRALFEALDRPDAKVNP